MEVVNELLELGYDLYVDVDGDRWVDMEFLVQQDLVFKDSDIGVEGGVDFKMADVVVLIEEVLVNLVQEF